MKPALAKWIADADARRYLQSFSFEQSTTEYVHIDNRLDDYYISLVGELFLQMREGYSERSDWARLGNAFVQVASTPENELKAIGISSLESSLFAASAFYCGGFPASAYLTIKGLSLPIDADDMQLACFELLRHSTTVRSQRVTRLLGALRSGQLSIFEEIGVQAINDERFALTRGPEEWIYARMFQQLFIKFSHTNIRAVLPEGGTNFWDQLINLFIARPTWEFFPSQIDAISKGLLTSQESFSLQMPTGAGKTALCETLLYWYLKRNPNEVAILLVPYRSLASELRKTLVKPLNSMGILSRCVYGGTVPSGEEIQVLDNTKVVVATPEALSGLLSVDAKFTKRISLVICDEGHLLDGGSRGIALELLLARMKAREQGSPRFIFISAIVPNIEEINSWLGGTSRSVVRSDYRPALAEYALLRDIEPGMVSLEMHPHESDVHKFIVREFLSKTEFKYKNSATGRSNTYNYNSIKTRAIASARKTLLFGATAVFAANKRGNQGAVGLAEELLAQLDNDLNLPKPLDFSNLSKIRDAGDYLEDEYGKDWVGSKALKIGAVLHHGDIPQETREVVETLVRRGDVKFVICTSTLAEGVNLPIRTLVLYSVSRLGSTGRPEPLLARDIKNLVGRAGRAGVTTKGLVICANEEQWPFVEQVARQTAGEKVTGYLFELLKILRSFITIRNTPLTNQLLEASPIVHTLIDGIDATLIDLAAEEIGEAQLMELAIKVAEQTFASKQVDENSKKILLEVFRLRAVRVVEIRTAGRLSWIRETGTRVRLLNAVETGLLPRRESWSDITNPLDSAFVQIILEWAWTQTDLKQEARKAFRLRDNVDIETKQLLFIEIVKMWISGKRFKEISINVGLPMDDLLGVYTGALAFALQTIVEQGVALLAKLLEAQGIELAPAVAAFPEHLRFGVPTAPARVLAAGGIHHRYAVNELGSSRGLLEGFVEDRQLTLAKAKQILVGDEMGWRERLGKLVYENTLAELS